MGDCTVCKKSFSNEEYAWNENPEGILTNCNVCFEVICRKCGKICQKCKEDQKPIHREYLHEWERNWYRYVNCPKCMINESICKMCRE